MARRQDVDGFAHWSHHTNIDATNETTYPYTPSIASTASSSSDSIFSVDAPSSQSSESSSVGWLSSSDPYEIEDTDCPGHGAGSQAPGDHISRAYSSYSTYRSVNSTQAIAPESRQHPRRTQRFNTWDSQSGKAESTCARPPPSLVRQSERKDNFVDSLVDTTTQMIETIWPLSVLSCGRESGLSGKQQNLIGLRTFVQEVLRRSKTSYSTLQVALYYLILVQSCIPKHDLTMEQSEDSSACRAMQCGRRMFLAALILASKYLQDRNYSARAWSKISGLKTYEINANELAFLSAVKWKLHMPEPVFHRWTDIVLKYSPSAQANPSPRSSPVFPLTWKSLIPLLTPELDTIPFGACELSEDSGYNSPGSELSDMSPPPRPEREESSPLSVAEEPTPTKMYDIPRTLEPTPRDTKADERILPPLPHLGTLPTPQMTPQTGTFCTPAVSTFGSCHGRSMGYAMAQIQTSSLARSTLDYPQQRKPTAPAPMPTSTRHLPLVRPVSSDSSPESLISDTSSRSSRSSSISSVASSNWALPLSSLAVQATRRCANMQLYGVKEKHLGSPGNDGEALTARLSQRKSTEGSYPKPQTYVEASYESECPPIYSSEDTREAAAAVALHDLQLNHQNPSSPPAAIARPQKGRKRSRPNSMDLSIQSSVREIIAPRCLGDITNQPSGGNKMKSTVLPDAKRAESFLVPKCGNSRPSSSHSSAKPALSGECLPRKRTCAGSDRGGKEEARLMMQRLKERESMQGPGMWEGII